MALASDNGMTLASLLAGIAPAADYAGLPVHDVCLDSHQVTPGALFLAVAGATGHGLQWLPDARRRGAAAVLYEPGGAIPPPDDFPAIAVPELRRHAGELAARCHDDPSRSVRVVGVTGTNGKTSCAHLLAQALHRTTAPCGLIGTLGNGFPGALDTGTHTTPDATVVQALLARFRKDGATRAVMEVSSHALDQHRVDAVRFQVAVFTNLSRDHLDYHGDEEAYFLAKRRLFAFDTLSAAVLNAADERSEALRAALPEAVNCLWYGAGAREHAAATGDEWLEATQVRTTPEGLDLVLDGVARLRVQVPLPGRFNAENVQAVAATLLALGRKPEALADLLLALRPVPGRMERHGGAPDQPLVLVDYAHTPDALTKVLAAAREHCHGRLWCVFGCGGDRDAGKRPMMGAAAARGADRLVLTDDNPRGEAPQAIVQAIREGIPAGTDMHVEHDRAAAIRHAVHMAAADDVVVVAGKGHETWQERAGQRTPFSDSEQVRVALRERAA